MILRPFKSTDTAAVMKIWREASSIAHPFLADDLEHDAALVEREYLHRSSITVAEVDRQLRGFVAVVTGFVGALFVSPQAHRSGIGRALMEHVERTNAALQLEVYLANSAARKFYAALGYEEVFCSLSDDLRRPHPLVRLQKASLEAA